MRMFDVLRPRKTQALLVSKCWAIDECTGGYCGRLFDLCLPLELVAWCKSIGALRALIGSEVTYLRPPLSSLALAR